MSLSPDEIALYDRQIRLWGISAQLRLRSAKVLIINIGSIGTEVVKNLVLGGLHSIELADTSTVQEKDFAAQHFLPNDRSIVGKLKIPLIMDSITALNPRVHLSANTTPLDYSDTAYWQRFDLIIATELSKQEILALNTTTRQLKLPLYVAGQHGVYGYIFTDLVKHTSTCTRDAGSVRATPGTKINAVKTIESVEVDGTTEKLTIVDQYVPLEQIFTSKEIPKQLNRRQLRRMSSVLPLVMGLLDGATDVSSLEEASLKCCDVFGLPRTVVRKETLEAFFRQRHAEYAPTAAILGGVLAQDVIQFLSGRESPINNVLVLDGVGGEMPIYQMI